MEKEEQPVEGLFLVGALAVMPAMMGLVDSREELTLDNASTPSIVVEVSGQHVINDHELTERTGLRLSMSADAATALMIEIGHALSQLRDELHPHTHDNNG